MSYREIDMIEVKEILTRLAKGEAKSRISSSLGVHRRTIRRYLKALRRLGIDPERDGLEAITNELIEKIMEGEGKRNTGVTSPTKEVLLPLKSRIENYLEEGLTGAKILQILRREGIEVSMPSFYRFLEAECSSWVRRRITVRLPETEPGDYAQCDFERLGRIYDEDTKRERLVYAFIMVLCFSRHQYVHVSFKQDLGAVIKGCEGAFRYFGGIPRRLIFDNLKPVINKSNRYNPTINRAFLEYSQHRGFIIDPAPAGMPTGKPHVERVISYVRENFFMGESFVSLKDMQERVIDWCSNIAGRRIHQTTMQKPIEVFERIERERLKPYPGDRYDIPFWGVCKVHPDHHIRFLRSLYSLPTEYIGKEVLIRGDSALVKVYYKDKLVKIHSRVAEGKRRTDFNDYPQELTP